MSKYLTIVIFSILIESCYPASAQKIWIGPAAGVWENAVNWLPQGVPRSNDDVVLNNTFRQNNYTITLPDTTVNIHSLWIEPAAGITVELIIPPTNKSSPALVINETGNSFVIKKGGIFRNTSGLTSGQSLQLNGLLYIFNDGRYIHNSRSSHATEIVARLATITGTERGIFQFDVPGGSYPISMSNRIYGTLVLSSDASGGTQTYNASGTNLVILQGDFQINNGVQFNADLTKDMVIHGDYIQKGGVFNVASQPNNNTVKIMGDVIQSASAAITETSAGLPVLELCGTINQQVSLAGNILNDVTLKINNPGGITLTSALKLPYHLLLTDGKIKTSQTNLLTISDNGIVTGGSNVSFIDGPLKKLGDDDFEFPLGKQGNYAPLKITGSGGTVTDEYIAEYFLGNAGLIFGTSIESPPLIRISNLEYWNVNRLAGASAKKIRLFVGNYSNATLLDKLVVVRWDTSVPIWKSEGNSFYSGIATGTIVSDDVSGFGAFTLGSTVIAQNPLPLISVNLHAERISGSIELTWESLGIDEPDHFDLEQSEDGIDYRLAGRVNFSKDITRYSFHQFKPAEIQLYFRLKIVQRNGGNFYSQAIYVPGMGSSDQLLKVFPSPATNHLFLRFHAFKKESVFILITDISGRKIKSASYPVVEGLNTITVYLTGMGRGMYFINLYGRDGRYGCKKIVVRGW